MRLLIAAPFLLVLILFALSNRAPVSLGLWPTGLSLQAPLSLVVLGAAALGFLVGGIIVRLSELRHRRRARRAEARVRRLEEELAATRSAPLAIPSATAPSAPPALGAP